LVNIQKPAINKTDTLNGIFKVKMFLLNRILKKIIIPGNLVTTQLLKALKHLIGKYQNQITKHFISEVIGIQKI